MFVVLRFFDLDNLYLVHVMVRSCDLHAVDKVSRVERCGQHEDFPHCPKVGRGNVAKEYLILLHTVGVTLFIFRL